MAVYDLPAAKGDHGRISADHKTVSGHGCNPLLQPELRHACLTGFEFLPIQENDAAKDLRSARMETDTCPIF